MSAKTTKAHRSHGLAPSALVVSLLALTLLASKGEPFRYSRHVQATPGFAVVELPEDVLAAARPGLSDVRLVGSKGEIGYALEERLVSVAPRVLLHDVEARPGRDTTALLDRGPLAPRCRELELEIAGDKAFLKPVIVEASPDGTVFSEIARSSIFRLSPGVEMARIQFAPNDRRHLRIRFDDVNSEPVRPLAARCLEARSPEAPLRSVAVQLERADGADGSADAFVLRLPSSNLPVVELELSVEDLAFAREARVYERILFRDELSRRIVGKGKIERSATGSESLRLGLGELSGSVLELEIDRAGAPLELGEVRARVRPRRLVFVAPEEPGLMLLYGSSTASPPKYDLPEVLQKGRPPKLSLATLGPAKDSKQTTALSAPARGPAVDVARWARRSPIVLPAQGPVAYLDLGGAAVRELDEVRIIDASRRQVPFLVEASERLVAHPLTMTVERKGTSTFVRLGGIDPAESLATVELQASAPEYFERSLSLFVNVEDKRGVVGRNELGSVRWSKLPESKESSVTIPVSTTGHRALELEIDDGDNPPLTLTKASTGLVRRRVNFLFEPGEKLELLSGNPSAAAPRYDLALIADAVLSSPALGSALGKTDAATPSEPERTPRWFWWAVVGAGLVVVLALARVRRSPSEGSGDTST